MRRRNRRACTRRLCIHHWSWSTRPNTKACTTAGPAAWPEPLQRLRPRSRPSSRTRLRIRAGTPTPMVDTQAAGTRPPIPAAHRRPRRVAPRRRVAPLAVPDMISGRSTTPTPVPRDNTVLSGEVWTIGPVECIGGPFRMVTVSRYSGMSVFRCGFCPPRGRRVAFFNGRGCRAASCRSATGLLLPRR